MAAEALESRPLDPEPDLERRFRVLGEEWEKVRAEPPEPWGLTLGTAKPIS
jgi:hypothetical protein